MMVVDNDLEITAYAGGNLDINKRVPWNGTGGRLFGYEARYSCVEYRSDSEGDISTDSLFCSPANGDYRMLSERGRHMPARGLWSFVKAASPRPDVGDPTANLSARRTPRDGAVWAGMSEWPIAGDLARDRVAGFADLAIPCNQWLTRLPSLQ
jgi:hypothetical protein